jgi:sugar lactone lactonase YvrE
MPRTVFRVLHQMLPAASLAWLTMVALPGAHAVETTPAPCSGVGAARVLLSGQGALESLAFDAQGRLLVSRLFKGELARLDQPTAAPVTVATGISGPGGISVLNAHEAYIGTGNSLNGLFPGLGLGGIAHVNLDTGVVTPRFKGLGMANGMVRASDGTFYASDDLSKRLDRVLPDGTVEAGWLKLNSNGMALSKDQKTLFVNQMLPAKVLAVDRASGQVRVVAEAPASRKWTWLDGLDIDAAGRLYVVAYWGGEVWRLEDGRFCRLVDGLSTPAAVAVGRDANGFAATSIYVVTHSGELVEVPQAVPKP